MRGVFHKVATHGIAALSLFLFTASNFDCLAQPLGSAQASGCCKQAPCKKSPGQPPHSSCQVQPANPESLALPQWVGCSPDTILPVAMQRLDPPRCERVISGPLATHVLTESPPDLFLRNSSFLI
jgi:hypothetical protein